MTMKYHHLLKENHSACSSKNMCTRCFQIDRVQTQGDSLIKTYLSQSKVGKENSVSAIFISCKNDKFSGCFFFFMCIIERF